jgi:glycine/D-amino acid oxidase-like deaminating enzyme
MADAALIARYRARSLWLDGCTDLEPRPALGGDVDCDVAVVGAGFTGLWAAYYLKTLQPDLRVVVIEQEIAGFGPSGRNGGWVSAGIAANPRLYAKTHGADAVLRAERETYAAVGEIGRVAAAEGVDCGFTHSGSVNVATSRPQLARLQASVKAKRARGIGEDDLRLLDLDELAARVRVTGAVGAAFTPHCARVDPARLARGLAAAAERHGVAIYERTKATAIEPGRVVCAAGTVRARHVLRATEAYTTRLDGEKRRFLPLYSLMIATEPLAAAVWDELGWGGRETISDQRHLFFYAQRTVDDRIAIGGRGAPYRLGAPIDEAYERRAEVRERLATTIRRHFPAARDAAITHHWGGPLGVPRDWCTSVQYDPATGFGWAGGYAGHGVVAANVAGRTLADLVLDRRTDRVSLPWVGHRSRLWEPEPLRFIASRAIVKILGSADRYEDANGKRARRVKLVEPFILGR